MSAKRAGDMIAAFAQAREAAVDLFSSKFVSDDERAALLVIADLAERGGQAAHLVELRLERAAAGMECCHGVRRGQPSTLMMQLLARGGGDPTKH